ncbi:hypothetical protein BT69DRAFT_1333414 [Atractiella rhizophila]|nr:hypothetical protein BT69DRAFT_1333414 [Atractiella rhizophila]
MGEEKASRPGYPASQKDLLLANDGSLHTYPANCHCQAVKFTVTMPPLENVMVLECNCSICSKNGYLLVYPFRDNVRFEKGEDKLKEYRFGNKHNGQMFCSECGTSVLIDFKDAREELRECLGVNIRTFADMDSHKVLTLKKLQDAGDKREPLYEVK